MDLRRRVLRFVRARSLLHDRDRVLVAISGGVDSVVLLHILKQDFDVVAAHFDHVMRPDSDADAAWLRELCGAWEIPLISERADHPLAGETEARIERYRFLDEAAQRAGATRIATAHHADDQIETVLFRLLRGAGLRGLAGIPVRRGKYVRPLLRFSKRAIEEYARKNQLEWRDDATNAETKFARNRIRHDVLPRLGAAQHLIRDLARHSARTERAWNELLQKAEQAVASTSSSGVVELARPALLAYDPELRSRLVRRILRRFRVVPSRAATRHIAAFLEGAESGTTMRIGDVGIERAFENFRVFRFQDTAAETQWLAAGDGNISVQVGHRRYEVAWQNTPRALVLRGFRPGDRIRLPFGTKKLKKLFAERRIPVSERDSIPLLVDENGAVLYVHEIARAVDAPTFNVTVRNAEPG